MTIEEDKELEGIVGVKMDFPDDTCPANYTDVNFVMTAPDGEQLRWLKVKSETQWKWEFYTCKEGLKRLDRGDKIVCAKFINATGITKAEAISQCQRELGMTVFKLTLKTVSIGHPSYIGITTMMGLIGVHSIEESKWMRGNLQRFCEVYSEVHSDEAAKHTPTGDESLFYWVDGAREGTCESTDSFDKKNLFRWGDWLTVGTGALTEENTELSCTEDGVPKSCLVVMSEIPNRSQVLSDANCEETKQIAGAFCGTV
ncbi:unnamed protein product [Caenorhabditis brenneri]